MQHSQWWGRGKQVWTRATIAAVVAIIAVLATGSAGAQAGAEDEVLEVTVGMPRHWPPQYGVDEHGNPQGFAIDVLDEIARLANLHVTYQIEDTFPQVFESLKAGRVDLSPNFGIAPGRDEFVDYTAPVETFTISLFVRDNTFDITGLDSLAGRNVAVVRDNFAIRILEPREVITLNMYDDVRSALLDLVAGRVDALAFPAPGILGLAQDAGIANRIKIVGEPLAEIRRAIAVRKNHPELLGRLRRAVDEFVGTPAYEEIYARWYGTPEPYWTTERVGWSLGALLVLSLSIMGLWRHTTVVGYNRRLEDNVAQRAKAEEMLRHGEASLASAQRIAHLGSYTWDIAADELAWSEELYRIFGREPSSFTPNYDSFLACIHPHDRSPARQTYEAAMAAAKPYNLNIRILRPDGSVRIIHDQGEVSVGANGKPALFHGAVHDITERKEAERQLVESEERYRTLIETMNDGLGIQDPDGNITYVNQRLADMVGYSRSELEKMNVADLLDAENLQLLRDNMARRREGHAERYEAALVRKDGSDLHVLISPQPIFDGQGQYQGSFAVMSDITSQELAARKLVESEARLDAFFADAPAGLVIFDRQHRYAKVNTTFAEIVGGTVDEVVGKRPADFLPEEEALAIDSLLDEVFLNGTALLNQVFNGETSAKPGVPRQWVFSMFPIRLADQTISAAGVVIVETTERMQAEEELKRLNEELEMRVEARTAELQQAQDELIRKERLATLGQLTATVGHELRNPLGTMRTSLYVLQNRLDLDDADVRQTVERLDRNITRCDNIIDELLDYTRVTNLDRTPTALDDWMSELLDELEDANGVTVHRNLDSIGTVVAFDRDRMRRVIVNLYDNARQAIAEAGVATTREHRLTVASRTTKDRVELIISDTGPGMEPEVHAKAFEPLYSTKGFGVGLGLPIVKQIMDQHGGGIVIESEPGSGTRVVIWLPVADTDVIEAA